MFKANLMAGIFWAGSLAGAPLPLVADFSQGFEDLSGGLLQAQGVQRELTQEGGAGYLRFSGKHGRLTLPLQLGGAGLNLDEQPYGRSIVLRWLAPKAGAALNVCLIDTLGTRACAHLIASKAGWQESAIGYAGGPGSASLPPDATAHSSVAIELQLTDDSVLGLQELRLDPPAEAVSADTVAAAFGGTPAQVRGLRRLGLPENLVWVLQRVLQACACSPADLGRQRATRSWGEVAALHGLDWPALMADVEARQIAAGLPVPDVTPWQDERSWINADLTGGRP